MAAPSQRKQILVVDDDEAIKSVVCEILQNEAYDACCVISLGAAVTELSRRKFDVALLDLMLGERSGEELLPTCAALGLPAILYSASSGGTVERIATRWRIPWVAKPFENEQLIATLARAIEQRLVPEPPAQSVSVVR